MTVTKDTAIRVKAYICTWSHFINEDIGVDADYRYSPDVAIRRIVCVGSIDPAEVIQAFIDGVDGVFVGTCEPETCRFSGELKYQAGNKQATAKLHSLKEALAIIGLDPNRIRVEWLSPKRPERFPAFIEDFKVVIGGLGKVPRDDGSMAKLRVMKAVLTDFRVRWLLGKKLEITTSSSSFGEIVDGRRFKEVIGDILKKDYIRSSLLHILDDGPATVEELSERTGVQTEEVLKNLMRLRQKGQVSFGGTKGQSPLYTREGPR